jgi:hypothetical protein
VYPSELIERTEIENDRQVAYSKLLTTVAAAIRIGADFAGRS